MMFPCRYAAGLADRILQALIRGRSLREVCQDDGMPATSTERKWVAHEREGFAARYKQARKLGRAVLGRPSCCTDEIVERILCGCAVAAPSPRCAAIPACRPRARRGSG